MIISRGVVEHNNYCTYTKEAKNELQGTILRASGNLVIVREVSKTASYSSNIANRGSIVSFSPSAGQRMRRFLRESISDYRTMVTLTYPGFFDSNGKEVKEHLRRMLQEFKREFQRVEPNNVMAYSSFWFLEFQQRGAPHFHIFTTAKFPKDWIAKKWYEIVGSDDIRHLHAGTRVETILAGREGCISYASKYAAKLEQKDVPEEYHNVGRFWGVSGNRCVMSADTLITVGDMAKGDIRSAYLSILAYIKMRVDEGKAKVIARKDGVLVVVLFSPKDQLMCHVKISAIKTKTQRHRDMFAGAELDLFGSVLRNGDWLS